MKSIAFSLILGSFLALFPFNISGQESKPNMLTQKEASSGWILLFDGETQFGWSPRGQGDWTIADGAILSRGGQGLGSLSTTTEFVDFQLSVDFDGDSSALPALFLRAPVSGEINQSNCLALRHPGEGKEPSAMKPKGQWNQVVITLEGIHFNMRLNGEELNDEDVSDIPARGTIAFGREGKSGEFRARNLKLRPLGLKSIFNGKDLTGWKLVPGHQSVFSVTTEGWLNVKNGNGDLQSEAKYGDFIFQIDIISNGDHLNSGVFFRASPGEFWSGYESQIRNQWEGSDRTKPVDFGTGGIYNRQPARRVVSSDREWFTKTIVAHGPHMAVWINGYQVSDFTDKRPANDNARQGYRSAPGVLSLQGHDPTTDLSFRNIRISELPPARK